MNLSIFRPESVQAARTVSTKFQGTELEQSIQKYKWLLHYELCCQIADEYKDTENRSWFYLLKGMSGEAEKHGLYQKCLLPELWPRKTPDLIKVARSTNGDLAIDNNDLSPAIVDLTTLRDRTIFLEITICYTADPDEAYFRKRQLFPENNVVILVFSQNGSYIGPNEKYLNSTQLQECKDYLMRQYLSLTEAQNNLLRDSHLPQMELFHEGSIDFIQKKIESTIDYSFVEPSIAQQTHQRLFLKCQEYAKQHPAQEKRNYPEILNSEGQNIHTPLSTADWNWPPIAPGLISIPTTGNSEASCIEYLKRIPTSRILLQPGKESFGHILEPKINDCKSQINCDFEDDEQYRILFGIAKRKMTRDTKEDFPVFQRTQSIAQPARYPSWIETLVTYLTTDLTSDSEERLASETNLSAASREYQPIDKKLNEISSLTERCIGQTATHFWMTLYEKFSVLLLSFTQNYKSHICTFPIILNNRVYGVCIKATAYLIFFW